MNKIESDMRAAAAVLAEKAAFSPKIAIVLGSGLGDFAEKIEPVSHVSYGEIPGLSISTAPFHKGRFVFGFCGGAPVAVMQGRIHYYEGVEMVQPVLPLRLLRLLGCEAVLLTNAVGAVNRSFSVGDFMLIEDHISSFVPSPLRGPNCDFLGPRFPDMTQVYDLSLREAIQKAASCAGILLRRDVLLQTPGPQFESPAEIRFFERLGVDAVGMSTVCEAIAARHCGYRVAGISWVSNMASGILPQPLDANDIVREAEKAVPTFQKLVRAAVGAIAKTMRSEK